MPKGRGNGVAPSQRRASRIRRWERGMERNMSLCENRLEMLERLYQLRIKEANWALSTIRKARKTGRVVINGTMWEV